MVGSTPYRHGPSWCRSHAAGVLFGERSLKYGGKMHFEDKQVGGVGQGGPGGLLLLWGGLGAGRGAVSGLSAWLQPYNYSGSDAGPRRIVLRATAGPALS